MKENPGYEVEVRLRHKQGHWVWVRGYSHALERDGTGCVTRLIGLMHDITERKRAEEALQTLNERLEARVAERTAVLEAQSEQLRSLSARLLEAQENERRALALELHDRVGQNLTGLDFNLSMLKSRLEAGGPEYERLLSFLDRSIELVEQTGSQIRNVLAEYGLVDTLVWYADRQASFMGLSITVWDLWE